MTCVSYYFELGAINVWTEDPEVFSRNAFTKTYVYPWIIICSFSRAGRLDFIL